MSNGDAPAAHLPHDGEERVYPQSFAQQRLWFVQRMQPESVVYHVGRAFVFAEPLDAEALERAVREVVRRHDALRTVFRAQGSTPAQVVLPRVDGVFTRVDLGALPPEARRAEAERLVLEDANRPFDLERGPLIRVHLVRMGEGGDVLALQMHHIVSDGWSMGILFRELAELYEAFAAGDPSPLPELEMQYAELAQEQRERLTGAVLQEHLDFWRRSLAGAPALLELPTDRPRPAVAGQRGTAHRFGVPEETAAALTALARAERSSLYMIGLAAFQLLLSRWSGQDDVVVGSPIAGRTEMEAEPLIGFFVNTLVLRGDLSGDPSFRALLARTRETLLDAYDHQELPFERLVDELKVERTLSHHPLCQVIFSVQNAAPLDLALGGVPGEAVRVHRDVAHMDVVMELTETPGKGIIGLLEYSTDLFEPATMERFGRHYARLLASAAARPDAPVSSLELMDDEERRTVLHDWNATARPFARDATLPARFAGVAAAGPERVALVGDGAPVTYGELAARAHRLARALRARGVREGTRVGLAVDRSAAAIVAMLAILEAGGSYVPLDAQYPADRLAFMIEDAACALLVVGGEVPEALAGFTGPVVSLERDAEAIAAEDAAPLPPVVGPESEAYVIYTSGSTGKPKGVAIPHRGVLRLESVLGAMGVGTDDVALHAATLSFDASVAEIWGGLLNGGRVLVFTPRLPTLEALSAAIREHGPTWAMPPVGLWSQMVDARPDDLGKLRLVMPGGDVMSLPHARRCLENIPQLKLVNGYGPTENSVVTTFRGVRPSDLERPGVPIGVPVANTRVYVLDAHLRPCPIGVPGELCAGGDGVAIGYVGRPELTAERFVDVDLGDGRTERVYRTGDRARWLPDGGIEFLGRLDGQVKLRGFRVEPGEVETALMAHAGVRETVAAVRDGDAGRKMLVAYFVAADPARPPAAAELRAFLARSLPEHMVPAAFVALPSLPLTPSGKVDRRALPAPDFAAEAGERAVPRSELERRIAAVWAEVLQLPRVGADESFFELGGNSLLLIWLHERLRQELGREELALVDLFHHPTVRAQAAFLGGGAAEPAAVAEAEAPRRAATSGKVAVVGMAGRFPGAMDVEALWRNLREGIESVSFFTPDELRAAGVPEARIADPRYVPARGTFDGVDLFDAGFFGYGPRDAEILDPQHRLFLECAWEALERAGYAGEGAGVNTGVFAGVSASSYLALLRQDPSLMALLGDMAVMLANDKDFIATRAAYKLGLGGPAMSVQTACSTSGVAVHVACRSLIGGECDVALAGGASVRVPDRTGYFYEEGGTASPDGHCRAFDAAARGAVGGNGVGVLVLKRLEDALEDGDTIHAVILGSAVRNDGALRVGFTAPGVDGQSRVVRAALAAAGVAPETIGYVETHGTGTELGDPIEVAALSEVFGGGRPATVPLGSVKTNVGHLDAAAGVTGVIKAVLALEHGEIPPSLHFETPNPRIEFGRSPFFVNTALRPWPRGAAPRRAGVSSFGLGGTNAHLVLEEAPVPAPSGPSRPWQLLVLSARTPAALDAATERLAAHFRAHPDENLADAAFTLREGRRAFPFRRAVVVGPGEDAASLLEARPALRAADGLATEGRRGVAFLFPGLGEHYVGMGRGLYASEPVFREVVDRCAGLLQPHLGADVREVLYPPESASDAAPPENGGAKGGFDFRKLVGRAPAEADPAAERLNRTELAQPTVFVVGYALAKLWESWGVTPEAVIGHSLGEYVAACVAGVLSLEDALALVAARAKAIAALPGGAMLAVTLSAEDARAFLVEGTAIATVNAPELCVVSGPHEAVEEVRRRVTEAGHLARPLPTTHAFHSPMMEPAAAPLSALVAGMTLRAPAIPLVSNVTGTWMTGAEATDPRYWVRHLTGTVRFAEGLGALLEEDRVLLEVGPGQSLGAFARQRPRAEGEPAPAVASSLRHAHEATADEAHLLGALGRLWAAGARLDWARFQAGERRRRIPLPTYPWERARYWVDVRPAAPVDAPVASSARVETAGAAAETPGASRGAPRAALGLTQPYTAPRDETERRLARLWSGVLGVEDVGVHDDFFLLGGHSLLGTRLIARVREEMGVELPIQALFRAPTVARMAAEVAATRVAAVDPEAVERALEEVLGLTPEQVRALLEEELAEETKAETEIEVGDEVEAGVGD
ncbi:MAG TPA: amino acid adenylation domain-containing protein [Longimicrobium sp.]|nr:amino acid adenylation domain-containing protein [Longimicrobium sp.]